MHAVTFESAAPVTADFDGLYAQHADFVWRSVRRLGVPSEGVDDAVQDVFLVVHRRLRDFEGRSSPRTWLFGIALRVAKDHRKRASKRATAEPVSAALPDERSGPHEAASHAERIRLLDEVLEQMDERRRALFICSELEQMSAPEIAAALGENLNTIYSRIRAARLEFDALVRKRTGDAP